MTRTEFRKALSAAIPAAQCSVADALGTKFHPSYIDVFLPTRSLRRLGGLCKRLRVRNCGGVGVVPYRGSFRRIALRERT